MIFNELSDKVVVWTKRKVIVGSYCDLVLFRTIFGPYR